MIYTSAYRTLDSSSLSMPMITTMCAEKCPKVGEVFVTMDFLAIMFAATTNHMGPKPFSGHYYCRSRSKSEDGTSSNF